MAGFPADSSAPHRTAQSGVERLGVEGLDFFEHDLGSACREVQRGSPQPGMQVALYFLVEETRKAIERAPRASVCLVLSAEA
jgi:hypothetical protein